MLAFFIGPATSTVADMNTISLIGLGLLSIGASAAILCAGVLLLDLCAWAVRAGCALRAHHLINFKN